MVVEEDRDTREYLPTDLLPTSAIFLCFGGPGIFKLV
jgi:hypothetical protein